jgi:citrate lyase subunit beta / citryl-CoA lyase
LTTRVWSALSASTAWILPMGLEDVAAVVAAGVDAIRLPKTDCAQDIIDMAKAVEAAEKRFKRPIGSTALIAAIETARGILNAREIATASPRLVAIAIGAEDFVTDMHTTRSPEGWNCWQPGASS